MHRRIVAIHRGASRANNHHDITAVKIDKATHRRRPLAQRATFANKNKVTRNQSITVKLLKLPARCKARVAFVYASPIGDVDSHRLIDQPNASGVIVRFP